MKPDWDKLMAEYQDSKTILIADVDCTAGGKEKCEEVGIRGYPTIKYGDPDDLQDYQGGRSFSDLKKFADGLGPACSPTNIHLCDDAKKKQIEEFQKLSDAEREAAIQEKETTIKKLESDFEALVEGLQKQYQEASETKDKDVEAVKASGLGLLKSVHNHLKKAKSEL
mmetsp:Transcript_64991/g.193742  ORF Transcript_64991/g.193742 Transcript_64991/m.193742 type:complete len:168 (+) Transcript_64991:191-694(+)